MSQNGIIFTLLILIFIYYVIDISINDDFNAINTVKAIGFNNTNFKLSDLYNLSNNKNDSVYGQISILNNSSIYFTWQDSNYDKNKFMPFHSEYNYDIFFKIINQNNLYPNGTLNLSNNLGFSEHPHISSSNNHLFISWIDSFDNNKYVVFRSSDDYGFRFHEPIILSNKGYNASNVEITSNGNNVYLVWQQKNATSSFIIYRVSNDYGKTFSEAKIISSLSGNSYPKITAIRNNIYISWNVDQIDNLDNRPGIYFSKSNDKGKSFSQPINMNIENSFSSGKSQISSNDNHVYIMWTQKNSINEYGQLYLAKSGTNGNNFEISKIPLHGNNILNPSNVDIYSYDNLLFASFEGDTAKINPSDSNMSNLSYNRDIFFTVFNFNDYSNKPVLINVSNNDGTSECSSLIVNPVTRVASISWEDYTLGNHEIFFRNVYY